MRRVRACAARRPHARLSSRAHARSKLKRAHDFSKIRPPGATDATVELTMVEELGAGAEELDAGAVELRAGAEELGAEAEEAKLKDLSLDDLVASLQRARGGSARTQWHIQREDELRRCMQLIAVQRASQVSSCHAFQAHIIAEIDRLQGLHVDVQRRVATIEELFDTAAQQLLAAFVETTGGG
ncbi:hypothetical protein T492DRAFT_983681 [Pavlovales sp. CCMP2436]|nr:hypothetical protein T492DRAFT_983681 [Pavlovales sp. CCMP2436]